MDISMTFVAVLIFIWAFLIRTLLIKKQRGRYYVIFFSMLYVYVCMVFILTQLPIEHNSGAEQNVFREMRLIPFVSIQKTGMMTVLKDIFMLLPFGFLLPIIKRLSWKGIVAASAVFGASIEFMQLLLALANGSTTRTVDINEVIVGVIGGVIGYLLYIGLEKAVAVLLPEEDLLRKFIAEDRKGL